MCTKSYQPCRCSHDRFTYFAQSQGAKGQILTLALLLDSTSTAKKKTHSLHCSVPSEMPFVVIHYKSSGKDKRGIITADKDLLAFLLLVSSPSDTFYEPSHHSLVHRTLTNKYVLTCTTTVRFQLVQQARKNTSPYIHAYPLMGGLSSEREITPTLIEY